MAVRLRVASDAKAQIDEAEDWWFENRRKAPFLFGEEYAEAIAQLKQAPESGQRHPRPGYPRLRQPILGKTRHHLLYVYSEAERTVEIIALWNAVRGSEPRLPRRSKK